MRTLVPTLGLLWGLLLPLLASGAEPDCGVNEHPSGGHCCRAGEEWVPAKRMCVCLEPDVCGAKLAAPSGKQAKAAKAAEKAPAKKEEAQPKKDGWVAVGEALVQVLEFENMVNQMKGFDSDYARMGYAEELGKAKRRFTCQQIARLMAPAQIDTSAVEVAAHLYPHAVDPANFALLYGGLKHPSFSQAYLKQRLGRE